MSVQTGGVAKYVCPLEFAVGVSWKRTYGAWVRDREVMFSIETQNLPFSIASLTKCIACFS